MDTNSDQAVVLGASIAGLLAARVLSTKTAVGRTGSGHRAGRAATGREAPPGRAARWGRCHGLHPCGREILEELFPGFTASLVASGAVRGDVLGNVRWRLVRPSAAPGTDRLAGPAHHQAIP